MDTNTDANWWEFSISEEERGEKIKDGPGGLREVNPDLPDGRHLLDYRTYIGLERLLSCQVPSSRIPDERVFIITHQLFELVFKLMVFDMAVISETFRHILSLSDDEFLKRCTIREENGFWRPALTASARLKYNSKILLPGFIGYLYNSSEKDELFSSLEFSRFRNYLPPASGFQTAQFRLIQRGLGKSNLLSVRLFPAEKYWKNYEGREDQGPVRVIDKVILRDGIQAAVPPKDSPEARAGELDDLAHRVLEHLAGFGSGSGPDSEIRLITRPETESAVEDFREILAGHRRQQKKTGVLPPDAEAKDLETETIFRRDLEEAAGRENERRIQFRRAGAGAKYLHQIAAGSSLDQVLKRLIEADDLLHGTDEDSFLFVHYRMAAKRINDLIEYAQEAGKPEPPSGTGGGGPPYLWFMARQLIPLFPALIGFRGNDI